MSDQVLHGRISEWARRQPDTPAVSGPGIRLTYGQLDTRSHRLATALLTAGVRAGRPVLVVADRGPDQVIAQLAALQIGAHFVSVPPFHPAPRLRAIVDAAPPAAVLTTDEQSEALAVIAPGVPVVQTADADVGEHEASLPRIEPDALAYVAFTSGSTGRPKGIPHRHATLSQFVEWQGEAFGIEPGVRVAQLAPSGFDVSLCETFGALCRGAALHIPDEAIRSDAGQLAAWIRDERVSLIQVVPAHWRALLAELDGELPDLRTVLFVGEALTPGLVDETRERLRPAPRLVNLYGPTEVVCATFHVIGEVDGTLRSVPVGRDIPGREVFLHNDNGNDNENDGEGDREGDGDGEICIRSPYLTPGYLGADEAASARFAPDPTGGDGIVYRTGDLGRRLPTGELQFVGRVDNQVKLRGQRVELEDVEAAITAAGEVDEVVAAVREGHDGAQLLVAFVVPRDPADFDADEVRSLLADAVPSYMVPSRLVTVDGLPRNANGKVDRKAIQDWAPLDNGDTDGGSGGGGSSGPGSQARSRAGEVPVGETPRGETEEAIADIWCELLGLDTVGRNADLFTLGGDSLLATRLISRIRAELGVRVTLGTFFEEPTVAGLAAAAAAAPSASPVPLLRQRR
jgi:amino acid adenylation domain-containing protein